jgi:hypothetical protein
MLPKIHFFLNSFLKVEKFHGNALTEWKKIVELAKQSTVIFNNIDVGHYFDYACLSLAKSLGIPYAAGSSYCRYNLSLFMD